MLDRLCFMMRSVISEENVGRDSILARIYLGIQGAGLEICPLTI